MSLNRFLYYNAVIGGWAALLVWLVAELLFLHSRSLGWVTEAVVSGVLAGLAIGAGLNFVSGLTSGRWRPKLSSGLLFGAMVAAGGGLLGALLFSAVLLCSDMVGLSRSLGWMVMGLGIGGAEGVYEQSAVKIRNGLIGGAAGGFLAGLLFDPILRLGSDMSSRAVGFVILGVSIGALIGLTHVILKEAWLTVVDGYGSGRQLILSQTVTVLGRGDHLPLPFLGYAGRDLESEHLRVSRYPDGQYVVEDNGSRIGTSVNGQQIMGPVPLTSGDLIKLGSNIVRFEHRERASERGDIPVGRPSAGDMGRISTPPPPPKSPGPPPLPGTQTPRPDRQRSEGTPPLPTQESPPRGPSPRIPPPPPPPA